MEHTGIRTLSIIRRPSTIAQGSYFAIAVEDSRLEEPLYFQLPATQYTKMVARLGGNPLDHEDEAAYRFLEQVIAET